MKTLTMIFALLISASTYAGPGHGHSHGHSHSHAAPSLAQDKTVTTGKFHVDRLVRQGKLHESWENAKHDASVKKKFGHRVEWVVTFLNDKGVKGKKLYIFLKESGEFIAANFTGK